MFKYIVELWLDGYSAEDVEFACDEFLREQLNTTASYVTIKKLKEPRAEE